MSASQFIDYYEVLEISPNANSATIERVFRFLAQLYHPDNQETGDSSRFNVLVDAHNTLKDPIKRAQFDIEHKGRSSERTKLINEVGDGRPIESGIHVQNQLLSLLYVRCRQDVRKPGIGEMELGRLSGCPAEHLEFHLWYMKEKGWIRRTENGAFAITAEGVDRVNSQCHLLTYQKQD